jgi:hypothetical protein
MIGKTRICPTCGKNVKGRADKKFCDDSCRNNYNNVLNSDTVNYVRNVNNILRKNRRILEDSMQGVAKTTTKTKTELIRMGFTFEFYTSTYSNPDNQTYYFCYEYGYRHLDNEKEKELYLLVRNTRKEFMIHMREEQAGERRE